MECKLRYGNCLIGALYLMLYYKTIKVDIVWRKCIPHFLVNTKEGYWHFTLVRDIFPDPFCYICFIGRFEKK